MWVSLKESGLIRHVIRRIDAITPRLGGNCPFILPPPPLPPSSFLLLHLLYKYLIKIEGRCDERARESESESERDLRLTSLSVDQLSGLS